MIRFSCNERLVNADEAPAHQTLLEWLRATGRVGTKEGCAEGDCGACTVLLGEPGAPTRAVNSCLVLLPQVHGRAVVTVEGLAAPGVLHPAQTAMVEALGSQCGYCTPGFVCALAEACHRTDLDASWKFEDQIAGNLCRCTGYRPIREALARVAGSAPNDAVRRMALSSPDVGVESSGFSAPTTLEGAWDALAGGAQVVAGATDLGLEVTQRHARFRHLLDLSRVAELRGVGRTADGWSIGAATPLTDVEAWAEAAAPMLHRMLRYFGARQIKQRGTMGGNLCTASPIGDLGPVLLALDATLVLASRGGERQVAIADWFVAYRKTALRSGEILSQVLLRPRTGRMGAYKVSRRRELDISAVSAAFRVVEREGLVSEARFAFGGVAATPLRLRAVEEGVVGHVWTEETAERAATAVAAAITPLDDHRGSAAFRRTVAGNLVRGFWEETRDVPFRALPPRHSGTVIL